MIVTTDNKHYTEIAELIRAKNDTENKYKPSEMVGAIDDIISKNSDILSSVIDKSITEITIPGSVSSIGTYMFYKCFDLTNVVFSEGVTEICGGAFYECKKLNQIEFPSTLQKISGDATFGFCGFTEITLPEGFQSLGNYTFRSCSNLTKVYLPNSLIGMGYIPFQYCTKIKEIVLGDNFNCNASTLIDNGALTVQSMINMFTALADRTGQDSYTLKLGSANLAKLTDEEKSIATGKNWILA